MSFRHFPTAALFLISASGCAKFGLNEGWLPRPALRVDGGSTVCLQDAGKRIDGYLAGSHSTDDIAQMFACADDSVQLFLERTKTKAPGVYAPVELRNFLEKYFFGEGRISDALMTETMEFKRSIVGGQGDVLTASELRTFQRILVGFRNLLLRLDRYRPLTLERVASLPKEQQDEVLRVINQSLAEFGEILAETAGDYPTDRLEGLLQEFEKIYPSEGLRSFIVRLPLIRALKPVLLGTPQELFRPQEWPRFLVTLGRLVGVYVKGHQISPEAFRGDLAAAACGPGRQRLTDAVLEVFAIFDEAIRHHGSLEMIPITELHRVIDTLQPKDLGLIGAGTLKRLLRPVFRRFLAGLNEGFLGRGAEGLTRLGLERARRAFEDWSVNQRYLEGAFAQLGRFGCEELADSPDMIPRYSWEEINSVSVERSMGVGRIEDLSPRVQNALTKFRRVLPGARPLQGPSGVRVRIDAFEPSPRHTFNSLSFINLLSVGYVLGQQGYRNKEYDGVRRAAGDMNAMVGPELDVISDDLREISIDLKFQDPEGPYGGGPRFRDGNLFTYAADGNDVLNIQEGVELLSFLLSGKDSSSEIHTRVENLCPTYPGGVFQTKLIEIPCFVNKVSSEFSSDYAHLPGFVSYLKSLSSAARAQLFGQLVRIAKKSRIVVKFPHHVETLDTDVVAVLPHYLEATYLAYDANRDGWLNTDEALAAFPRFEPVIRKVVNDPSFTTKDYQALYTYLLENGKAPETASEKAAFVIWNWNGRKKWNLRVQRVRILDIFEALQ